MLKSYLKIAWRNVLRKRVFSCINILGLAMGMTAYFFITQYTRFHYSFDTFHDDYDQIYRVGQTWIKNGEVEIDGVTNWYAAGPAFERNIPEVESQVRVREWVGRSAVEFNGTSLPQGNIFFADRSFFTFFDYQWLKGDIHTAFDQLNDVVISSQTAAKYFGQEDPIGKSIVLKQGVYNEEHLIKGVIHIPENSWLQPAVLLNYERFGDYGNSNWVWSDVYLFLKFQSGIDPENLRDKFNTTMEPHADIWRSEGYEVEMTFDRMDRLHTITKPSKISSYVDPDTLFILTVAALAVLVMAWVNSIQLNTSQALSRAKEVGIRRTMGSEVGTFFLQFVVESLFLNFIAFSLSYTFFQSLGPVLYPMLELDWVPLDTTTVIKQGLFIVLVGSLIAGLYPTLVFSFQNTGAVLRRKTLNEGKGVGRFRNIMLIFQLTLSCTLISGATFIFFHLKDIQNRDIGYDISQLMVINAPIVKDSIFNQRLETFKNRLNQESDILHVSVTSDVPGKRVASNHTSLRKVGASPNQINSNWVMRADEAFLETYGLELITGRGFVKEDMVHGKSLLLNESAVYNLGFKSPEDALGADMLWDGSNAPEGYKVIGVIKNYHHTSFKNKINPTIYVPLKRWKNYITVKLSSDDLAGAINNLSGIYQDTFNDDLFDYTMLGDYYFKQYDQDRQLGELITLFGFISLGIVVFCLVGYAGMVLHRRRKEISIRKVFGASVSSLFVLLSGRFIRYILLSYVLATSLVYWYGSAWLSHYFIEISINQLVLLSPLMVMFLIASLSIMSKMVETIQVNPTTILKEQN
ncbi:MAG: ABC transporter permease [Bacteroidota bacterium]